MNEPSFSNSFTFNPLIDPSILYDLYENDYQYIEEIFNTALTHLDEDIRVIETAYSSDNPEELRRSVHKIKPTFGFLGIPQVEQKCKEFEDACKIAQSNSSLRTRLDDLLLLMEKARNAVEEDYKKLIIYNKP